MRACPVKCLPNEMQRRFHRGEAYFSGVVKIIALTRDVHVPRPGGQLDSCPILLSCRIALELKQKLLVIKGKQFLALLKKHTNDRTHVRKSVECRTTHE